MPETTMLPWPAVILCLTIAACLAGCGNPLITIMTHAPNKGRTPDTDRPDPGLSLRFLGLSDEGRYVPVGPPPAKLAVWVVDPPDETKFINGQPRGTILVLHGFRIDSGWLTGKARYLAQAGYRAVLVDLRGHGGSSGDYITYGLRESQDLVQVIDHLESRGLIAGRLGAWGISMGASTAIQLAARDPRIDAVVAVTPYTTMRAVVPNALRTALPVIGWLFSDEQIQRYIDQAGREAGFDPDQADTLRAIQQTDAPVLIVGGKWDAITPFQHSQALQAAAPDHTRLVGMEWTGHIAAGIDLAGQAEHESIAWFNRWLAGEE